MHALSEEERHATTRAKKAVNWMRGHAGRPFFLYLATLGEMMRALDELKLSENTLVILTRVNGGMLNQEGGQQQRTRCPPIHRRDEQRLPQQQTQARCTRVAALPLHP